MVVAVVMPVVFVLRILTNAIKILKLVVCKQKNHFITIIVKHTTIHVTLIVAWPEPKPLWSILEARHIGYCQEADNVTKTVRSSYVGRNVGMKEIERNHCWPCT